MQLALLFSPKSSKCSVFGGLSTQINFRSTPYIGRSSSSFFAIKAVIVKFDNHLIVNDKQCMMYFEVLVTFFKTQDYSVSLPS